jgi:hypothetical protein
LPKGVINKSIIYKYRDKQWLYKKYIEESLPCRIIADLCNCSSEVINLWLVRFNIPRRIGGFYAMTIKGQELKRQQVSQWGFVPKVCFSGYFWNN